MTRAPVAWHLAAPLLVVLIAGVAAADSRARCDAAALRAAAAGVSALVDCKAKSELARARRNDSCQATAQSAFEKAMAKAHRTPCTAEDSVPDLWARVTSVAADLAVGVGNVADARSGCAAKRLSAAADGVRARTAVHAKVRKSPSPEGFSKGLLSSLRTIARSQAAAEKSRDCREPLNPRDFVSAVDTAVQRLLEHLYGCAEVAPEDATEVATGKWRALLDHASTLGYSTMTTAILCPGTAALEGGQDALMTQVTLTSDTGAQLVAAGYPAAGVASLLRRDADQSVTLFHWLGGVRVAADGHLEQVDEAGQPVAEGGEGARGGGGLFDACREAHREALNCWVQYCTQDIQSLDACWQVAQCVVTPWTFLTDPLSCAADGQTLGSVPCPKPGQLLPCALPGKDSQCPVSGMCNILDVCKPDRYPESDGDLCSPDHPPLGRPMPICVDDTTLQNASCQGGRCLPNRPIPCAVACCGRDGQAHCWSEPGSCEPTCGDGFAEGAEECDDHNTADGDGCSGACKNECDPLPPDAVVFWRMGGQAFAGGQYVSSFDDDLEPISASWTMDGDAECPSGFMSASSVISITTSGLTATATARAEILRDWCFPGENPRAGFSGAGVAVLVGVPWGSPYAGLPVTLHSVLEWSLENNGCLPYGVPPINQSLPSSGQTFLGGELPCPGRPDLACAGMRTDMGIEGQVSAGYIVSVVTQCSATLNGVQKFRVCGPPSP